MLRREVAVVPASMVNDPRYGVRVRERRMLFWSEWFRVVDEGGDSRWSADRARYFADKALDNGFVPSRYSGDVIPILALEDL